MQIYLLFDKLNIKIYLGIWKGIMNMKMKQTK